MTIDQLRPRGRPPGIPDAEKRRAASRDTKAAPQIENPPKQNTTPGTTERARILSFPAPAKRTCAGCVIPFVPRRSWFRLCPRCHAGAAGIIALRRARKLLVEVG